MQRNQLLLIGLGVAAVIALFAFGRISPKVHDHDHAATGMAMPQGNAAKPADFKDILLKAKGRVPAEKLGEISRLENAVVRGDVQTQQLNAYRQLYLIWDGLNELPIAAHYAGEAAKLENSGKNLTFAANLFLDHLSHTQDPAVQLWEVSSAIDLLDRAIALEPGNDTLKLRKGALLVDYTGEPMKGIGLLREVAEKNPDFLDAQLTLANFSIKSGQFDKAIERMDKVLERTPDEPKALFLKAVAHQSQGENDKAVELLRQCRKLIKDPALAAEIDGYIKSIK